MSRSHVSGANAFERNERWYLVHTLPRREQRACVHLEAQGFSIYFPQISKTIRHARQLRTVRAPLFPRYLFIALDLERDRWLSVRSSVGVSNLVTCGDRPIAVPPGIIETFIRNADGANLALFDDGLKKGQQVRLLSGPFADFVGTLERLDENGRVRVLLSIMGSAVAVSINRAGLLPAA
jgi:transcription elongation factor/antiterminator RfaH